MKFYIGNMGKLADIKEAIERGWATMISPIHVTRQGAIKKTWRRPKPGLSWALDNGAFALWRIGERVDVNEFVRLVKEKVADHHDPDFIIVPDIVAHPDSLAFSIDARSRLPDGQTYYLSVQDGMTVDEVDAVLDQFNGIFVGGTKGWKLKTMRQWATLAKARNIPCHVGRLSSLRDIQHAELVGVTSIDSTTWAQRSSSMDRLRTWDDWSMRGRQTELTDGFDATFIQRGGWSTW